MQLSWILVADNSNARIFSSQGRQPRLTEVADLIHPEGRISQLEQDSDKPGRSFNSRGGARHAMEPPTSRKLKESDLFARRIADLLNRRKKEFDDLVIICAPRFLGLLRKHLDNDVRNKITREIRKSIVQADTENIRREVYGENKSSSRLLQR